MGEAIFGITAADDERHHHVAVLPPCYTRAARDYFAGDLKARDIGRALRWRVEAHALHDVRPIDARGGDLDENLAGLRLRQRSRLRR
jgi:hypothetical protein